MNLEILNKPISEQDFHAYKEERKATLGGLFAGGISTNSQLNLVGIISFAIIFVVMGGYIASIADPLIVMSIVAIVLAVVFGFYFASLLRDRDKYLRKTYQLHELTTANNWRYKRESNTSGQAGSLFVYGHSYKYRHIITSPTFEVGEVYSEYGQGRSRRAHIFAYLTFPLPQNTPNMLLDGKKNNFSAFGMNMSNLPVAFDGDQVVSLEGDFDKYYTLYAPEGYGRDVRYIFTPNLMEMLIHESSNIDLEIIDNKMYVYFSTFNFTDPAFWKTIERLMQSIGDTINRQTQYYQDDNTVSKGVVADGGRRLKRGVSVIAIILIVLYGFQAVMEIIKAIVDSTR